MNHFCYPKLYFSPIRFLGRRSSGIYPSFSKLESDSQVVTFVHLPIHTDTTIISWKDLDKMHSGSGLQDTVTNMHLATLGVLPDTLQTRMGEVITDGKEVFVEHHKIAWAKSGSCLPSYINVRDVSLYNGTVIGIDNQKYIESDKVISAGYHFTDKFKYEGFVKNVGGADSMFLYLPDVTPDITDMTIYFTNPGSGGGSVYDAANKLLRVRLPSDTSTFKIKQADPCVNCFFPSTVETIDSIFNFDDGTTQELGHKLDIVQPQGELNISGSIMELKCGIYLRNRDSLLLRGGSLDFPIQPCDGIGSTFGTGTVSAIIINSGTALVLDSGSHTYIQDGTAILVKSGGSLVINDSSFVQIGSSSQGKAVIMAEAGAFVQIFPGAHIEFFKTVGDTVDTHLFYVTLQTYPTAIAGINPSIESLLLSDTLIPSSYSTIPFCELDSVMAPAVWNNDWGCANFMPPVPNIVLRNDTLCPGELLVVNLKRILNENNFWFEVCRMDSMLINNKNGMLVWVDTCVIDTILKDTVVEGCVPPYGTPDFFKYHFKTGSTHRLTFKVSGDCGTLIDSVAFVYVTDSPDFSLHVPTTACPGIQTVKVTTSGTYSGRYSWNVQAIDSSGGMPVIYNNNQYNKMLYEIDSSGALPDTFDFPQFEFLGGRKYLITLVARNDCGIMMQSDTVSIPSGAYINLGKPTAYAEPINGAVSVQLHGYVSLADSFRWEPTTWLDTPTVLTPVSTPLDSITYVLIAHSGSCVATDTVRIHYNRVANAGYSDSVCFDTNQVLIGNMYDMSLFLGYLYYYNTKDFKDDWYYPHTSTDPTYFRYFTHFMMHDKFYTAMTGCGGGSANAYDKFIRNVQKDLFFKEPWYADYYKSFIEFTDPNMPVFDNFVTHVTGNTALKDNLDSITYWGEVLPCMDNMFNQYDDFLSKNLDDIHVSWDKIVGEDTSAVSAWDEYFIGVERPEKSSIYRISVITPSYAEIDEITILVDTALTPLFSPAITFDSTVYFSNFKLPESTLTTFEWDFGDGGSSVESTPTHTFAAFDSNYVVCLTATNLCGSWMFCDTVWIDSAHWGANLSQKAPDNSSGSHDNPRTDLRRQVQQSIAKGELPIVLTNYPNPFGTSTTIGYEIWQAFSNAELRITNMLGQPVFSQKLQKPIDKILIDGSVLHDGLYYYSIIIDGSVKQTKSMAVIH